ncbi:hypothetical protein MJ585_23645 [Klebsiella pneumoniae]|nr:hypothetical protein MJ585_23645 [Klebsiella pneumoniae]
MNPCGCQIHEFIRGNVELVRLSEAEGRVAAEGARRIRRACCAWCPARSGRRRAALFLALEEGGQYAARFLAGAGGLV